MESSRLEQNRIFLRAKTSSSASCALKESLNRVLYKADWLGFGNVPSQFFNEGCALLMSALNSERESAK